jgi:hypothetical protein
VLDLKRRAGTTFVSNNAQGRCCVVKRLLAPKKDSFGGQQMAARPSVTGRHSSRSRAGPGVVGRQLRVFSRGARCALAARVAGSVQAS